MKTPAFTFHLSAFPALPLFIVLFLFSCHLAVAQESHYHKGLRSQADNDKMGTVGADPHFNGGGMYWSRVRNVDDVAITHETHEDTIARIRDFTKYCHGLDRTMLDESKIEIEPDDALKSLYK